MSEEDPVEELAALLEQIDARPVLKRERIATSTLYDADYHVAVVACAFAIHAKPGNNGGKELLAAWLKLLQFVAARPRLAPHLRAWADTRRNADLETWSRMPRGFVGDRIHDRVVELLVAAGILERDEDTLVAGAHIGMLDQLYERLKREHLFATERQVLEGLVGVHPFKTMLRGA